MKDDYQDKKSSSETILKHWKPSSIRKKNLQYMTIELFNVMKEFFFFCLQENKSYNLRSDNLLALKNIQKMLYGIQRFSNMGTELWDLLPRNNSSHCVFKNKIIKWIPGKCPCELCQTHIKKSTKYIKKKNASSQLHFIQLPCLNNYI